MIMFFLQLKILSSWVTYMDYIDHITMELIHLYTLTSCMLNIDQ